MKLKLTCSNNSEVARSAPPKPVQTSTNPKLSSDNGLQTPVKENGKGDRWEELSDALSAKKAQLAQANNGGWNKKGSSSGGSAWSYKALRGSGMGPVMNYIKSFESHSGEPYAMNKLPKAQKEPEQWLQLIKLQLGCC
ncbi:hypothetical protein DY000_02045039 [Brassica cretica]|uniref:Uncharacterized protein n=1 Tax=Brassica cretica TaxID=69181 RepID=A0ABQ7FB22_BRACR|nr:hypothetical protein DY000_02045039 [Brassica cretica]